PQRERMAIHLALCLLVSWSPPFLVSFRAAEYEQKQGDATLRIDADKIEAGRVEMRLSEEVHLTVSVEGGEALDVQPLSPLPKSSDWQVRRETGPDKIPLAAGRVRWVERFRLAPLRPGDLSLAVAPLRFRASPETERWEDVAWQPVPVHVITEV